MRRFGMYTSGSYVQNTGTYYSGRKEWKKNWGHKKNRRWAAAMLAVGITAIAVIAGMSDVGRGLSVGITGSARRQELFQIQGGNRVKAGKAAVPAEMIADTASMKKQKDASKSSIETEEADQVLPYIGNTPGATDREPKDIRIVLDPGHGGADDGCVRNGVQEKEINLQVALLAGDKLKELGYQVILTRDSDRALTLEERVKTARQNQADIYVSIHQNASDTASVNGMEVLYSAQNEGDASSRLSQLIQKCVVKSTGVSERELLEEEGLYVIRECTMPSCLVETGFLSNAAERGKLTDASYQAQIAEGIASGIDLFFHPKTMYLTFDDGPSEENTAAVLDILKARDIKATFFVVGENVRKHPEVAKRIVEEGHTIGIHCNRHEYEELYASVDSYLEDFEEAYAAVKEITGVEVKLFRFPGGSINSYNAGVREGIIEAMTERGFIYYDWNASLEDAVTKAEPEKLLQNALSSTLGRKKVVMLAHDIVYPTTLCLNDLLDQLPEYHMEPLNEKIEPVEF